MKNRIAVRGIGVLVLSVCAWCSSAWAQPTTARGAPAATATTSPAAQGVVVLDTAGAWRMYHVFKAPVASVDGNLLTVPSYEGRAKLDWYEGHRKNIRDLVAPQTALPPANWKDVDFDDSEWLRGTAARAARTPYLERLYLRGKFTITDPAKVKDLLLLLGYHGGCFVYVNGKLALDGGCLALYPGIQESNALAEAYPPEAFVRADGNLMSIRGDEGLWKTKPSADDLKRMGARERESLVLLTRDSLREGMNVVAIEIIRAPYDKAVVEQPVINENHNPGPAQVKVPDLSWNTCEIRRVRLLATGKDGVVSAATRGVGFQVWNSPALEVDYDLDQGEAGPLQPIRLVGARNGVYSGKVVIGCDKPITNLAATAGELKGDSGTIPASAVQVRYAMPWGNVILTNPGNFERDPYPAAASPLLALYETPPKEVPVYKKAVNPRSLRLPGQPEIVFGAVVPVWVTVKVPKDAKPGLYAGAVVVKADGLAPVNVQVRIKVIDWTIPDPLDHKTWCELIQSPDTLAVEYNLPLWSPRHWELIDRSMNYVQDVGSKVLFVPLIAQSNAGNEESMVRWMKTGEDKYDYDFSIMEKYLDVAEKHMGKPRVVVFNVWDLYLGGTGTRFRMPGGRPSPLVTLLDTATGKTEKLALPDYQDPNSKGLWKPLFDQLRQRMQKRGLEKSMMLGMVTDNWAHKEQVEFLKDVSGNLPWANAGHYTRPSLWDGLAQYGYQVSFFGFRQSYTKSQYGWRDPNLVALFERVALDSFAPARWRNIAEQAIAGNMRGAGRLGADTWQAVKDKTGKRMGRVWERWPGANWGYLNCNSSTLAPAPEGAVATMRYEMLREGLQECEARVAIEQALVDPALKGRLGDDLAARCADALLERQKAFWRSMCSMQSGPLAPHDVLSWRGAVITGHLWLVGSPWQQRSETIYSLAGEVAAKLQAR